jgi:SAM-dependent methyltransferase
VDRSAYDAYFAIDQRHFWCVARRELLLDLIARQLGEARGLELLDVGGNCTVLSRELGRFGHVTMIEPDAETVELARRELDLDARQGSLPGPLPIDHAVDVLTLFDVLEHIDDDLGALRGALVPLRSGGLVVITVPALAWLWSAHDVAVHHKRRYTRRTLEQLLRAAGLEVELLSYFSTLLFPLLAAQRLASRARGVDASAKFDVSIPPEPVNGLLRRVMSLEAPLLRRTSLPIGSSLVAVCRKR